MIEKVVIMGAAGRDFHNFNVYFRDNPRYHVVAFTAAQIEGIEGRRYPAELCGAGYPEGIPVVPEAEIREVIRTHEVDLVAFSYSDVPYQQVMHRASEVMAEGADFIMIGASYTMLKSKKPVVAVCAVRTGCGKSQTTRKVCEILQARDKRPVVVRHPMPYGDIPQQIVQRFASIEDIDLHDCTVEEREEYEPLVSMGVVVYAGVDYGKILAEAEKEADVIVWDGGNNDTSFYKPDVQITVFDPHRAGHELLYYPGETNMLLADIAVINKVHTAEVEGVEQVRANIQKANPKADICLAASPVDVQAASLIKDKRVLVVEDGPTLTHGEMGFGAGVLAAEKFQAAECVDPHPFAQGGIRDVFEKYPHIGAVLPAMGYSLEQLKDLEATINAVDCDMVLFGTPARLGRFLDIKTPYQHVSYGYEDTEEPFLEDLLMKKLQPVLKEKLGD